MQPVTDEARLNWYQRADGRWNADCACGTTLCGLPAPNVSPYPDSPMTPEEWHFANMAAHRAFGQPCGPVPLSSKTGIA